ncbi:hypothetical protein BREVNS_1556 [Brevinematales bacterium NS]|nr:hypothetical protein BREVNS_1556 [Brevinematales bacterium NS]
MHIRAKVSKYEMRPLHGCFLPLFRSGATPLKPRFFYFQGLVCLFYSKK